MTSTEFKFHTLANGLQIIGQPTSDRHSAALGFFVKTGARDEVGAESGVSHFLEHMLFKGTARRSALELTFEMGNIGAQANAFTSEENTVYYGAVLPEYVPHMLDILADMMRPALRQEDFDTEKQVILEEIALYQDRPHFYLFERAMRDYFGTHSAGNSVLGSTESIRAVTREQMCAYFNRRYAAGNIVLVATGNFDWNAFVKEAERLTHHWKAEQAPREVKPYRSSGGTWQYKKKNLHQSHVLFMADSATVEEEERIALDVLANMIGDSTGSRLYWELIDSGLADSAGADTEERQGTGTFSAYASTVPERLGEVRHVVERVLQTAGEFSDADLERSRTKIMASLVQSNELPMGQLMALGLEWNARHEVLTLKEALEQVRSVNRASIQRALEKYPLRTWSVFTLEPE